MLPELAWFFPSPSLESFLSLVFQTVFLSLAHFLFLLVFISFVWCCISCCLTVSLSYLDIFLVFFGTVALLSTLSSSSLVQSYASSDLLVIPSSVCVCVCVCFNFRHCILLFSLVLYSFYFLFHSVLVLTQFFVAVCEFLGHPCNHSFECYI